MKISFRIAIYIFAAIGFILVAVYAATELGLTNSSGMIDNQHDYFKDQVLSPQNAAADARSMTDAAWENTPEWQILRQAIEKDAGQIDAAAENSGVPARMIAAPLVVEQLRLFHDNREIFKSVFAPLKILGNQSQFSWGVMGIKQDTAKEIEAVLADPGSPFYPGTRFSHLLDYTATTTDRDAARFGRLTDENDRFYSYLYAGLLIRELEAQWQNAGFPIEKRPDIIATLFNIGFAHSHPGPNPQVGGAVIEIGSTTYSFGGLASSFYGSGELIGEFPK